MDLHPVHHFLLCESVSCNNPAPHHPDFCHIIFAMCILYYGLYFTSDGLRTVEKPRMGLGCYDTISVMYGECILLFFSEALWMLPC